jgi:hypothetical protein
MALLVVCSVAVHPFGTPKHVDVGKQIPANDLKLPPEIAAIVGRSCMDCHSNQTVWPWYSYVAPTSWLLERDVHRGRSHLNLSEWSQYNVNQRQHLLAEIASEVKNREMPLPQYTFIHHNAKLSDADTDLVYGWARVERRRLRASLAVVPANAGQPSVSQ